MAKRSSSSHKNPKPSSINSNAQRQMVAATTDGVIRSTCYDVDARSGALKGFHYSTTGAGGNGVPEVSSGIYTPPSSPPLTTSFVNDDDGEGATYTIPEECERLFCDTLAALFLGEGKSARKGSLGMGMGYHQNQSDKNTNTSSTAATSVMMTTRGGRRTGGINKNNNNNNKVSIIRDWLEIWDYVGGSCFRGCVVEEKDGRKSMFVFFEAYTLEQQDLKPGLMSIIELATSSHFDCSALVVCLDRSIGQKSLRTLIRDLGWVGFDLVTLDAWSMGGSKGPDGSLSSEWVFVAMEL
ncbi:MAG: hypothetical protein M1816_001735 [Peltula sp. TS41687]|nr:MAG: hypothetical protein M1816_001735 [Peltula sp. TS41687]